MGLIESLAKIGIVQVREEPLLVATLKFEGGYIHHPDIPENAGTDERLRHETLRGWNVLGFEKRKNNSGSPTIIAEDSRRGYYFLGIPIKKVQTARPRQYHES